MTTLAEMALRVAREVTDVMDGLATAGAATSLTDTDSLIQPSAYWKNGTLWLKSGTHSGKTRKVLTYADSICTFATLTTSVGTPRYSICTSVYPYPQIVGAINTALESTHVTGHDESLTGDGTTLLFSLPAGVYDIKRVEFVRNSTETLISTHWREDFGKLRFDDGYAPVDDDVIRIVYRKRPTELTADTDSLNTEINEEWLKYKAAESLLWWAVGVYGNVPEHRIEERMNKALNNLKGRMPRREIDIVMRAGGW